MSALQSIPGCDHIYDAFLLVAGNHRPLVLLNPIGPTCILSIFPVDLVATTAASLMRRALNLQLRHCLQHLRMEMLHLLSHTGGQASPHQVPAASCHQADTWAG